MGCAGSKSEPTLYREGETSRKGIPARVEIPSGNQGWRALTVGKSLDTTIDHAYEARVDNGGPLLKVVLKKPDALNTFASFSEYMSSGGDDDYDNFKKMLPTQGGLPIRAVILGESRTVDGRVSEQRQYNGGERILLLIDEHLVDATVASSALNAGQHHALTVESGPAKGKRIFADLNDFNHCLQLFPSITEYEAARTSYLETLVGKLAFIQDAITGNRLNVDDQVNTRSHTRPNDARRKGQRSPSCVPVYMPAPSFARLIPFLLELSFSSSCTLALARSSCTSPSRRSRALARGPPSKAWKLWPSISSHHHLCARRERTRRRAF